MKILCAVDGSEFSQWAIEAVGCPRAKRPLLCHLAARLSCFHHCAAREGMPLA